jgi:hypothetical protein
MKVFLRNLIIAVTVALVAVIIWFTANGSTAYLYALYLECKWQPQNPKSKLELEQYLHLYSTKVIQPTDSEWGRNDKLNKDERMMRYLILWSAPLDVVYDRSDNIKAIHTSYE